MTTSRSESRPAAALRAAIRSGLHCGPTAGLAAGYVQANVVILPEGDADEFAEFCRLNEQACPVIERTEAGNPEAKLSARHSDLRTDVPRYRVFRRGMADPAEPTDIVALWREDFVAFLLGCSFTFEWALERSGLEVRHIREGRNVPMYRTTVPCRAAGRFHGPLVVSMRPFARHLVDEARRITGRFPRMHGAPVHAGDPAELGIADLGKPDFGEPVSVEANEVPVFWACGVTPQLALEEAGAEIAITHSPGCMFVTDLEDRAFEVWQAPCGEAAR